MSKLLPRVSKIRELVLEDFRGFIKKHKINTDGDIVLILGKNGTGKSSLLYAIDCLIHGVGGKSILYNNDTIGTILKNSSKLKMNYCTLDNKEEEYSILPEDIGKNGGTVSWSNEKSPIQEKFSCVYQDLIYNLSIEEIVKSFFFFDYLNYSKHISASISKISNDIKNYYVSFSGFNPQEKRKSHIDKFKNSIEKIIKPEILKEELKIDFSKLYEADDLSNQINNIAKKLEKYFNKANNFVRKIDQPTDTVVNMLGRMKELFKSVIESEKEKAEKSMEGKNEEDNIIYFLKQRISDKRLIIENHSINKVDNIDSMNDVLKETILLLTTEEEKNIVERHLNECVKKIKQVDIMFNQYDEVIQKINKLETDYMPFNVLLKGILQYFEIFKELETEKVPIPRDIIEWFDRQSGLLKEMEYIYREWIGKINYERQQFEIKKSRYEYLKRNLEESLELQKLLRSLKIDYSEIIDSLSMENEHNYGEFIQNLLKMFDKEGQRMIEESNFLSSLSEMIDVLDEWIEAEKEIEEKTKKMLNEDEANKYKDILEALAEIEKREKGTKSIFKANADNFTNEELKNLNSGINSLLKRFHFPSDFLPIIVKNCRINNKWEYVFSAYSDSGNNHINFNSLSTGQKAQLYLCYVVGFNYILDDELRTHRIMLFDDITTSIDMSQLLPAATLFRQMAYTNSKTNKRQVFITCHHEDFANKLLDFLIPPPEFNLKVIRFTEWTPKDGPQYDIYDVKTGTSGKFEQKEKVFWEIIKYANNW